MDELEALSRAEELWVEALAAADLTGPSRLPGWSQADLVTHVHGGSHRYLLLCQHADEALLEETRQRAYPVDLHRPELHAAFSDRSTWDDTVAHRAGPRSVRSLLVMRVLELTLHAWDLHPYEIPADLDAWLVQHGLDEVEDLRAIGFYGSAGSADLLGLTGRNPA